MKSIHEFLAEAKTSPAKKKETSKKKETPKKKDVVGSSRIQCIQTVVQHLKAAFADYDISTRKFVWEKLKTKHGEDLISQIVRYPKTSMSMSNFTKLVMDDKK